MSRTSDMSHLQHRAWATADSMALILGKEKVDEESL